jgi:hypothetical protein
MENNMDFLDLMKEITKKSYKEKSKQIGTINVVLRNLSAKEEADVYTSVNNLKGTEFFYILKIQTLAKSIIAIKTEEGEEKRFDNPDIEKKLEILATWPTSVMDELYRVYSDLSNEIDKELGFDVEEKDKEISVVEAINTINAITGV